MTEELEGDEQETYFSHPDRLFPDAEKDEKIPTLGFLTACQGIGEFVGL